MSSREERVTRNESATREINEDIERAHEAVSRAGHVRMLCECGREKCDRVIAMTTGEYERVRADPRQFAIARQHLIPDIELIVSETDRYAIVAKREGTPAAIATEEDPRDYESSG